MDVQNFAGNLDNFRKNGQKEFPTPLAGRADQVLPLYRAFFFITFFKSYDFFEICKKN